MPKRVKVLSAAEVRRLGPGFNAVGGVAGLHLVNGEAGSSSWIIRIVIGGERPDLGLGSYPEVGVGKARELAAEVRDKVRRGIDPRAEKRAIADALRAEQEALKAARSRVRTFRQCAEAVHTSKSKEFRNPKHAAQWLATLKTYAFPIVGSLDVEVVTLDHVIEILNAPRCQKCHKAQAEGATQCAKDKCDGEIEPPLWTSKTETATRLRQRIESVLAYAITHGRRTGPNVAAWKGNLDSILPKPQKLKNVEHHKALPVDDMPAFWSRLRVEEGMGAKALVFAILAAARSGEVRGATWGEIDFEGKTWTVPALRMKAGVKHVVPLCPAAVELLEALPGAHEPDDLVFPATRGGMLSDMTLTAVLRRMEVDAVPHGFRSAFRDWASERTAYPREVCEQALAHTLGAVEKAYRRGDLLEKRRRLMRDWQKFLQTKAPAGKVVGIRG